MKWISKRKAFYKRNSLRTSKLDSVTTDESSKKEMKNNRLQNVSNWTAIIGTLLTIFFAIKTIQLTRKYGDSTEQIQRLDNLVSNQQKQNETLFDILRSLKNQDENTQHQIVQLSDIYSGTNLQNELIMKEIGESKSTNLSISKQLDEMKGQSLRLKVEDSIQIRKNRLSLFTSFTEINQVLGKFRTNYYPNAYNEELFASWKEASKSVLVKVESELMSQLNNSFLINNPILRDFWVGILSTTRDLMLYPYYKNVLDHSNSLELHLNIEKLHRRILEVYQDFTKILTK